MIDLHDPKRKMRFASRAIALLQTIEPMPVRPVVRNLAQVRPHGRIVKRHRAAGAGAPAYLSVRANARTSSIISSGSSMAPKCPPRGISVQCVTLYSRST